jgi:hypothetical protein
MNDFGKPPEPTADKRLEMGLAKAEQMVGHLLHLRRRFLYHHRSLAEGADPGMTASPGLDCVGLSIGCGLLGRTRTCGWRAVGSWNADEGHA